MKKMLADLGIMVAYNDELLARIQTIEVYGEKFQTLSIK